MEAPLVEVVIVTDCVAVNVPPPGLKDRFATCVGPPPPPLPLKPSKTWEKSHGFCVIPLQSSATWVPPPGQDWSRATDQKARRLMALFALAKAKTFCASDRVNTSGAVSFRPIMGVMPTLALMPRD